EERDHASAVAATFLLGVDLPGGPPIVSAGDLPRSQEVDEAGPAREREAEDGHEDEEEGDHEAGREQHLGASRDEKPDDSPDHDAQYLPWTRTNHPATE